jgi:hypothetical protein
VRWHHHRVSDLTSPHSRRSQGRSFLDTRPAHVACAWPAYQAPSTLRDPYPRYMTREEGKKKKVVELPVECQTHPRVPDVEILEPRSRVCGEGVAKRRRSCFEQGSPLGPETLVLSPVRPPQGLANKLDLTSSKLTCSPRNLRNMPSPARESGVRRGRPQHTDAMPMRCHGGNPRERVGKEEWEGERKREKIFLQLGDPQLKPDQPGLLAPAADKDNHGYQTISSVDGKKPWMLEAQHG